MSELLIPEKVHVELAQDIARILAKYELPQDLMLIVSSLRHDTGFIHPFSVVNVEVRKPGSDTRQGYSVDTSTVDMRRLDSPD
jgi:hypothetical protein